MTSLYDSVASDLFGQQTPIKGREKEMTKNYADGYTFTVSPLDRALRFMILGCY